MLQTSAPHFRRRLLGVTIIALASIASGSLAWALQSPAPPPSRDSIDVPPGQTPTVAFRKGGNDKRITALGEVPVEVEATDDYGLTSVEFRYSINGGPEHGVPLFTGKRRREVLASYLFSMKPLGVNSGDMIAYYAQAATDNDAPHRKTAKSDIYFLEIKK